MKKTPKHVSEKRQIIGREIAGWQQKKLEIAGGIHITPSARVQAEQQLAFCETQLKECRKRMGALRYKGKKTWTFKQR